MKEELAKAAAAEIRSQIDTERITELQRILSSVTVVEPPKEPDRSVGFGARVTVRNLTNELKIYRILGVDELDLDADAISWISPIGRVLLAAKVNERVTLPEVGLVRIVKVEYPVE